VLYQCDTTGKLQVSITKKGGQIVHPFLLKQFFIIVQSSPNFF
jgi:hypothetical protein